MRKLVSILLLLSFYSNSFEQSNSCSGAATLTIGGALDCGETTLSSTIEAGECFANYGGGSTEGTVWYRVDATNDSLVLNIVKTNSTNCVSPHVAVYGPFADGAGCVPGCATQVYNQLQNGDPGSHILLTGLSTTAGNNDYLIQIQGNSCGGPGDGETDFCVSVANPATNNTPSGASLIDECGTAFSNTTNGGYFQSGSSIGFNNLDGNNTTTCGTCGEAGDDTPFVINNVSWSTFCSLTSGTWQVTVNGVSNCTLPAPNAGIQASVFTGTSGALTNVGNSPSPLAPGASYTSPVITVNAGECAFLMIDGFAGDACDYSVTLTNISGGCVILALSFGDFTVSAHEDGYLLSWNAISEIDNSHFIIEKSENGQDFTLIGTQPSIGNHNENYTYYFLDNTIRRNDVYYRLSAVNNNGEKEIIAVKYIHGQSIQASEEIVFYPNPAAEFINVQLNYQMADCAAQFEIFNQTGTYYQSYSEQVVNGENNFMVPTDHLSDGTFIIRITTPSKVYTEKIVVKK